jgi:monolysocardiolipin acyltransferase
MFQQVQAKNLGALHRAILDRPKGTPLITLSNHASCIDDPVMWGTVPFQAALKIQTTRWTLAAKELTFTNKLYNYFFSRGQLVPVVRGSGVYQKAVDFCIQLLDEGNWIHIFPEGKVNQSYETIRFKWGIGRLIAESKMPPIVLPLWHYGMEDILPEKRPYIPQFFKKLTLLIGEPLDFSSFVEAQRGAQASAVLVRKQITDMLQVKMKELKKQAEELHHEWNSKLPIKYRTL